eukprot:scaffold230398_cov35-Tisochrysis_lutea.AAC.7
MVALVTLLSLSLLAPLRPAVVDGRRAAGCRLCAEVPANLPAGFVQIWPTLREAAEEEATALGMVIESINFSKGKLSVLAAGGGIDDLEALNRRLGELLDRWEEEEGSEQPLPAYMLEVASPGVSNVLQVDRDFETFKGFDVIVKLSEEFKQKMVHQGTLQGALVPCLKTPSWCTTLQPMLTMRSRATGRDENSVLLNLKGRILKLPREIVLEVALPSARREPGDPY